VNQSKFEKLDADYDPQSLYDKHTKKGVLCTTTNNV